MPSKAPIKASVATATAREASERARRFGRRIKPVEALDHFLPSIRPRSHQPSMKPGIEHVKTNGTATPIISIGDM